MVSGSELKIRTKNLIKLNLLKFCVHFTIYSTVLEMYGLYININYLRIACNNKVKQIKKKSKIHQLIQHVIK